TVILNSLIITNGKPSDGNGDGGGIINFGTLTLNNSTLSNNWAEDPNSTAGGDGGGIKNYNNLSLNNTTISHNFAAYAGGGIYSYSGTLTLNNSTVSDNVAG